MAARIRSTVGGVDVDEASRDDLVVTDIVTLLSLDAATLRSACLPERLALLVEAELDAVCMLALAQGVTVDVA